MILAVGVKFNVTEMLVRVKFGVECIYNIFNRSTLILE